MISFKNVLSYPQPCSVDFALYFKDDNESKLYEFIYSNIDISTIGKDKLDELINSVVKSSEFIHLRYKKITDEKHHIQVEEKNIEILKQNLELELDTHYTEMVGYGLSMTLPSNNFNKVMFSETKYCTFFVSPPNTLTGDTFILNNKQTKKPEISQFN